MKEKKKLLFVSANRLADPYPVYPLGLSYLQTYLRERCDWLESAICDMNLTDIDGLKKRVSEYSPDYVVYHSEILTVQILWTEPVLSPVTLRLLML